VVTAFVRPGPAFGSNPGREAVRPITFAAALILPMVIAARSEAQQAVYLLRHAEKLTDGQDGLKEKGKEHAKALVPLLKDAKIKAIYTSEFKRAQQTAEPLAASLGLTPIVVPHDKLSDTFDKIRADHPHDVVLIVGHSDSVPAMIKLWDAGLSVTIDDVTEFDRLFVLVPISDGKASLGQLRYHKED
jgi:phosphohistidine phosphatase SixA